MTAIIVSLHYGIIRQCPCHTKTYMKLYRSCLISLALATLFVLDCYGRTVQVYESVRFELDVCVFMYVIISSTVIRGFLF